MTAPWTNGDKKGTKTVVLQSLRMNGPISRIDLAERTSLSRATISGCTGELMEEGLIRETSKAASTGGRPAVYLELVSGSHAVIGADLDNGTWTLGAFDLLGHMLESTHVPVAGTTPDAAIQALTRAIPPFLQGLPAKPLALLGLSVPGLVDPKRGAILTASDLNWTEVEIGSALSKQLGWPTAVINRQRARGVAECRYGAGKPYGQLVYVGIGSGIAAGLFVNRQLHSGALGGAGELGHVTALPNGPLCPCGNYGCLQQVAALPSIVREAKRSIEQLGGMPEWCSRCTGGSLDLLEAEHVCLAADEGEELAVRIVTEAATHLGIALANVVNLLNPEAVILGGRAVQSSRMYMQTAADVLKQRSMPSLSKETAVRIAVYQDIGGALGAANYALDKHLSYSLVQPGISVE
jgi:predicted NBD/HSP70 family sugar kinase